MLPVPLRSFLLFIRFKVSIAVTFSAYAAALICRGSFSLLDLLPMSGIFLLAAGASALNQFQESEYDARMMRTRNRPVASGLIKPSTAMWLSLSFILAGLVFIAMRELWLTLLFGVLNIIWYNGFYTWLKRKSAFAVVPGALTGAIPVMMGWTAAGGSLHDPIPFFLAFFIFLWQVPHFWLLSVIYEDDYRKAGFPVLADLFSFPWMKKIIFAWLLAASLSSVLLMIFSIVNQPVFILIILILNLIVLFFSGFFLFINKHTGYRLLFLVVNIFMLLVFCVIVTDALVK